MLTTRHTVCLLAILAAIAFAFVAYFLSCLYFPHDAPSADSSIGPRAATSLKFLVVVSRHGNRSPIFTNPMFPYPNNDSNVWPFGAGQLSRRGRAQMYKLGKKIRSLYNGYLNSYYFPEDLKAYSTLVDRTLMSAELFLAGLYPPLGYQMWDKNIPWHPIPVYPNYWDKTELPGKPELCKSFKKDQIQSVRTFMKEENITAMFESIQPYTGFQPINVTTLDTYMLADSIFCADAEGLVLPLWVNLVNPEPLQKVYNHHQNALVMGTNNMVRFLQGLFFKEIINLIQAKKDGTMKPNRQMHYYSGHDNTLLGLQAILSRSSSGIGLVRPGSALIFELHEDAKLNLNYVQVLYIDGGSRDLELTPLSIPDCDHPCELSWLMNITHSYYNITDYDKECQTKV